MKKFLGILALGLALLTWQRVSIEDRAAARAVQFNGFAKSTYETVQKCLTSGNGGHLFRQYKYVGNANRVLPQPAVATYLDPQGSRLTIAGAGEGAVIDLVSLRPPSDDQLDLLNWCTTNPEMTWIAREYR